MVQVPIRARAEPRPNLEPEPGPGPALEPADAWAAQPVPPEADAPSEAKAGSPVNSPRPGIRHIELTERNCARWRNHMWHHGHPLRGGKVATWPPSNRTNRRPYR